MNSNNISSGSSQTDQKPQQTSNKQDTTRPGIQRLDTEVEYVTKELQNYIVQAKNIINEDEEEDEDCDASTDHTRQTDSVPKLTPLPTDEKDYFSSKVHFSKNDGPLNSHILGHQTPLSKTVSPANSPTPPTTNGLPHRPQHYRFNTSGSDLFHMLDKLNSSMTTDSNNSSSTKIKDFIANESNNKNDVSNSNDSSSSNNSNINDNNNNNNNNSNNNTAVDTRIADIRNNCDGKSFSNSSSASQIEMTAAKTNLYNKNKSHNQLNDTAHGVRMLNKDLFNTKFKLQIQNILIVTKHYDDTLIFITAELLEHILTKYADVSVYLEEKMFFKNENLELDEIFKKCCHSQEDIENFKSRIKYYDQEFIQKHNNLIDLVITLGGDGTVLYVSNIFQRNVPPVMSFSLGSLGFLTNFEFENYHKSLEKLFTKKITTKLRMRLSCIVVRESTNEIIERQILNELVIDRGPSPFISNLEVYGNGSLLTVAQADGLIIATPTGSTAYSLSAGGSLVYPEVNALCITPICPHTLSFRPIILPDSMILTVKVPKDSRSTAWCSFDGKNRLELFKGNKVYVRASEYSFPTVEAKKTEFIDSISRSLNWNRREPQKSLGHLLSGKNKSKYEKEIKSKTEQKERSYSGVGKNGLLHDILALEQLQKLSSDVEEDEDDNEEKAFKDLEKE
ncbi:hypothetical protein ACO0SA_002790 [Hanseniaspora valbyensis]